MAILLGSPQGLLKDAKDPQFKDWLYKAWKAITQGLVLSAGSQTTGQATLVAGTVTVPCTKVSSTSIVFVTPVNNINLGNLYSATKVVGTSFTIDSTSGTDGSTFVWILIDVVTHG